MHNADLLVFVNSGVAQGSDLGPLVFIIVYSNDAAHQLIFLQTNARVVEPNLDCLDLQN